MIDLDDIPASVIFRKLWSFYLYFLFVRIFNPPCLTRLTSMFYSKGWEWALSEKSNSPTLPKIKKLPLKKFQSVGEINNKSGNKPKYQCLSITKISSKPKNFSFLTKKSFWSSLWNTVQTGILMIRSAESSNPILKGSWNRSLMV